MGRAADLHPDACRSGLRPSCRRFPYLFLVGLQTPLYTAGMIFLLLENHKGLLNLHRSEHRNRQMAHHGPAHRSAQPRDETKKTVRRTARRTGAGISQLETSPCSVSISTASRRSMMDWDTRTGDAVLVEVSRRPARPVSARVDFACRLGGR